MVLEFLGNLVGIVANNQYLSLTGRASHELVLLYSIEPDLIN